MKETTQTGVHPTSSEENGPLNEEDAFNAFLGMDKGAQNEPPKDDREGEAPSSEQDDADDDEADDNQEQPDDNEDDERDDADDAEDDDEDDDNSDEEAEDDDDDEDDDDGEEAIRAEDDDIVEIKVGDKVIQKSVKDLKRLAGQEAALTKKSQQTSALQKRAEAAQERAESVLKKFKEAAEERYKQYEGLDLVALAASGNYSQEEIMAAKQGMEEARKELEYFNQELDQFVEQRETTRREELAEEAQEGLKQIQDAASEYHIPDFAARYNDIVAFAKKAGVPQETLDTTPAPWLWKLLDNNMRYAAAKSKLTGKNPKRSRKKGRRKVLKSRKAERNDRSSKQTDMDKRMKRLKNSGSVDDAALAFLSLE